MKDSEPGELLYRRRYVTQTMMDARPPCWTDPNKQLVYKKACPAGSRHEGEINVARWGPRRLPEVWPIRDAPMQMEARPEVFTYGGTSSRLVAWTMNFAHYDLFSAYAGPLLAQDELQVLEHPALGSLRETLQAQGLSTLTVEGNQPTPILVRGVERRCILHTNRDPGQGRPYGLYGNAFHRADPQVVERATVALEPPTISNILAMEAPTYGSGAYQKEDLSFILSTAYTGFSAAKWEANFGWADQVGVAIRTGFWGCGAYGGNRILMTLLQLLAADLSGLDQFIFYTVDEDGMEDFWGGRNHYDRVKQAMQPGDAMNVLIERILALGFEWGVSDGT